MAQSQTSQGAWWVFIDHKGKRKAKRISASKRAAEQVAGKTQTKIALGQFDIPEERPQFSPFASLLIQQGESLLCVKEQLGHHSIQITGHLVPGGNRQAVDKLDDPQASPSEATIRNLSATTPLDAVLPSRVSA